MNEQTMRDQHGVDVYTRWWMVDSPKGLVVIAHGASEHSARYDRFAAALNAAGLAAVALDHRGHGRTGAATGVGVTGAGGGMALLDDLHQLRAEATAAVGPNVPVYFFGHSMGSLIGLAYLVHHSAGLAGGVLCGFAANVNDMAGLAAMLQGVADAGMRDASAADLLAANNAPFEPARTKFDWLSRDEAEVDAYVNDPLCGDSNPLTFGYFLDLFEVVAPTVERVGDIACPVLIIAGAQDPAAGMGSFVTMAADTMKAAGVTVDSTVYPDARHELLNETNRDAVTADVVGWMQRHAD